MMGRKLIAEVIDIGHRKGLGHIFYLCWLEVELFWLKATCFCRTFNLGDRRYRYFYHRYNRTWTNERSVEIPVIWDFLRRYPSEQVLEVGNVLSHYFPIEHDVLDKYEVASGVISGDAADFRSGKTYQLIVSISTLEHIGWDETPKDSTKILRAVENLKRSLATGGMLVSTFPTGYNPHLDNMMKDGSLKFARQHCLKRISAGNEWSEVECSEALQQRFDEPFPCANGLVIGILEK